MYNKLFDWSIAILRLYVRPSRIEEIEGDVTELYELRSASKGSGYATRKLVWDVIRFFRLRYIREVEDLRYINSLTMFRNYFKIAQRNLLRNKFFAGINIAGLAIGITCCFFIALFIRHELSYDKFITDHDRIMRLSLNGWGATPAPFVSNAMNDFPEIEETLRITTYGEVSFSYEGKVFSEDGGLYADSTFFSFFDWPLIEGNPQTALTDPSSIVLTESMAQKFFPREDMVGKVIRINGENKKVTGITPDFPHNSHIGFNYLVALPREKWVDNGYWTGNNFYSYLKLKEGKSAKELESKFPAFVQKYMGDEILSFSGHASYEEYLADEKSSKYAFFLYPVADMHLHHKWMNITAAADIQNIYTFSIIAIFVLLIACINFMNLATARAATRSKEVGVRKVLGSLRHQLRLQFLTEAVIISFIGVASALALSVFLLPHFNELSGKHFEISDLLTPFNLGLLGILGLITGLFAGLYPAFYLSAIKPVTALKGLFKVSGHAFLRKGLVTFQFTVSILLIISTVIVFGQVYYMTNKSTGIDTEHTLVISNAQQLEENTEVLKSDLLGLPQVSAVGFANSMPSSWVSNWTYYTDEVKRRRLSPDHIFVTEDYQEVLGIELVAGEFFKGRISDTTRVVVNEAFIRALDWPLEEAVGKVVKRSDEEKYRIAGVMKDFHLGSFRNNLRPLLLRYHKNTGLGYGGGAYMMVRVTGNYEDVISKISEAWPKYVPDEVLNFSFLNEEFNSLYEIERNFGKIFTTFSIMAILIACLGLFALSAFMLQQRLKEVAMRKVLGATLTQIIAIFVRSFLINIIIGSLIAIVAGYYLADQWLANFAYRMGLNPLYFIVPVLLVSMIAIVTIVLQILKSGNVNPAVLLKNE